MPFKVMVSDVNLHPYTMVVYDAIRPEDPFGKQMLLNLEARGCPLLGRDAQPALIGRHCMTECV